MARPFGNAITLMYHGVVPAGTVPGDYDVDEPAFREHVAAALVRGARPGFTFDDGLHGALVAASILEEFHLRGTFFIVTGHIGEPGVLGEAEIAGLHRRGHTIGSHSHTHPGRMNELSHGELAEEWEASRTLLAAIIGAPVFHASVPNGRYSADVARAASAAGYRYLFTSEPTAHAVETEGVRVVGRYCVKADTPTATIARLANGDPFASFEQWAKWNAKKAVKILLAR